MGRLFFWLIAIVAAALLVDWWRRRCARVASLSRLASSLDHDAPQPSIAPRRIPDAGVEQWLFLAGYRQPDATARFWFKTVAFAAIGALIGVVANSLGLAALTRQGLSTMPGRVAQAGGLVAGLLPVLLALMAAALPTVEVRRTRRRRVRLVMEDLYPSLELFASLAQAGLAFDAALARVLKTLGPERPLARELMTFQAEILSGADRAASLRRLAQRIDVPQVSSFTAALIRSHEVGIGLASVLRRQADDLRTDMRERAMARAQSLPARLVFPLVLCFLPGIFVMSLGPAFYGFLVETSSFGVTR